MPAKRGDYPLRRVPDARRFVARTVNDFRQGRVDAAYVKELVPLLRVLIDAMHKEHQLEREEQGSGVPRLSGRRAVDDIVKQLQTAASKVVEERQPVEAEASVLEEGN